MVTRYFILLKNDLPIFVGSSAQCNCKCQPLPLFKPSTMADAGAAHEAPDTPTPSSKRKAMAVVQGELAVVAELVPASAQTDREKELTAKVAALEKTLAAAKQVRVITALCPDILGLVEAHVCIKRRMEYAWEFMGINFHQLQHVRDGSFVDFLCGSDDGLLPPVSIQDLVVLAHGPEQEAQKLQGKWLLRPRLQCQWKMCNPANMKDVITLFGWDTIDVEIFAGPILKALEGDDRLRPIPGQFY